jgi:hypothetical protein
MISAPKENWQAPISSISASGWAPKATGRKQIPMNINTAPVAMIQFAVFEDIMVILKYADRRRRGRRATSNLFQGYMLNISGYGLRLQMTKVTDGRGSRDSGNL